MKGVIYASIIVVLFSGCSSKVTTCPIYPKPSKQVLVKIQGLNDSEVDRWMVKQFKLNKKLKVCKDK